MDSEFIFEIKEHIGVLKSYSNGWQREVTLTSWNNAPARIDIRDWNTSDYTHMTRGITLHREEALLLLEYLQKYFEK